MILGLMAADIFRSSSRPLFLPGRSLLYSAIRKYLNFTTFKKGFITSVDAVVPSPALHDYVFWLTVYENDLMLMPSTLILLTWTIWRAPTNASKWWTGFNPYPANVGNMASSYQC